MAEKLIDKIKQALRLKRALQLMWRSAPGWTLANATVIFFQGMLPLLSLYLMKLIIDAVTDGLRTTDKKAALLNIIVLIGIAATVTLLKVLSHSLATKIQSGQKQLITLRLHHLIHEKAVAANLEWYENPQYHDMLHRAQTEVSYRPDRIVNGLVGVVQNAISLICILGLLFSFQGLLAIVVLASAFPEVVVGLKYAEQIFRWQTERTQEERKSWFYHFMLTSMDYAKEIRLFKLGSHFKDQYLSIEEQLFREKQALETKRCRAEMLSNSIGVIAIFGVYIYIAYAVLGGRITLGDMVMLFQAFQQGQNYFQEMMKSLAGLYEDNLFLSSLYELLDLKEMIIEPSNPQTFPDPITEKIVFRGVGFHYPGRERMVLKDINLEIQPGQIVALVGENGSGKTTLINLLCRFYDPVYGSITIDGVDLRQLESTELHRNVTVIFQDYGQYPFTARENVWFGNISLPINDDGVITAAVRAGADGMIRRLPGGYETILCNWFKGGEEISMGEWQKIALARTMFRDAQIIVLDEPTSCMDAKSEYTLFCNLREMAAGKTVILISHRLSNVRLADRILVLENGVIEESGTHAELIQLGGTYANLFASQADASDLT